MFSNEIFSFSIECYENRKKLRINKRERVEKMEFNYQNSFVKESEVKKYSKKLKIAHEMLSNKQDWEKTF